MLELIVFFVDFEQVWAVAKYVFVVAVFYPGKDWNRGRTGEGDCVFEASVEVCLDGK